MSSSPSAQSPDVTESRPSFRKPANDTSRRNYRRHSPSTSRSQSPSSPGRWKRNRSPSLYSQDDGGVKRGRRVESEELGRGDAGRSRRGTDAGAYEHRNRDRYGKSDDYNYDYNRRHSSHHDRSLRHSIDSSNRSDYYHRDERRHSRVDPRSPERTFRDRGNDESRERRKDIRTHERDRDKEKDRSDDRDRYRSKDRELASGRAKSGARRADIDLDVDLERSRDSDIRDREKGRGKDYDYYRGREDHHERDRHKDKEDRRGGDWYKEKQESKVDGDRMKESFKEPSRPKVREERETVKDDDDHKNRDLHREKAEPEKDYKKSSHIPDPGTDGTTLSGRKEAISEHSKERTRAGRDSNEQREKGRKHPSEFNKLEFATSETLSKAEDVSPVNPHGLTAAAPNHVDESGKSVLVTGDEDLTKGTKWGPEAEHSSEVAPLASEAEVANDFNHAKLAAMRAAELVNKNLGAGGFMSADQKKKLLWGSKHQEPVAASATNVWDAVQFADRERQEKFNKLMGVKGEVAAGPKDNTVKVSGLFTAEKQQELQQDLEKQFTAGLRRRDGRTVGLGL